MDIKELIKAQKTYNNIHNEGADGYNPYDALIDSEAKRLAAIPKWTKEQTQANREAWNKTMRSFGSKITAQQLRAVEAKFGFSLYTLKDEVAKHNL